MQGVLYVSWSRGFGFMQEISADDPGEIYACISTTEHPETELLTSMLRALGAHVGISYRSSMYNRCVGGEVQGWVWGLAFRMASVLLRFTNHGSNKGRTSRGSLDAGGKSLRSGPRRQTP